MGLFEHVELTQNQKDRSEIVCRKLEECEAAVREHVPRSPEQTLCLRRLQEAGMWANKAISNEGKPNEFAAG